MANTDNLAGLSAAERGRRTRAQNREADEVNAALTAGETENAESLEVQVGRLQADIKAIAASLAHLTEKRASEVKHEAEARATHLVKQGQRAVEEIGGQASQLETNLKDTIREKPLTAVASAVGLGFLLALLSRR